MGYGAFRGRQKPSVVGGGDWPNAPGGWTTVYDTAFNDVGLPSSEGWLCFGSETIVTDGTAPHSPSNVLENTYTQGAGGGNSQLERQHSFSTHYAGFWYKLSNPFDNAPGMKCWYPHAAAGGYAVIIESSEHPTVPWQIRVEGNDLNLPSNVQGTPGTITRGVWHQMEFLWNEGTQNFKFWLDGIKEGDHDVSWSLAGDYTRFVSTWGTGSQTVAFTGHSWLDHAIFMVP